MTTPDLALVLWGMISTGITCLGLMVWTVKGGNDT